METAVNYSLFVDPNRKYSVSYTIDSKGNKIIGATTLLGKDMTENQIKEYVMALPELRQAIEEGNYDTCPYCKRLVPVELTYYNPDEDEEPSLISCLICRAGVRII